MAILLFFMLNASMLLHLHCIVVVVIVYVIVVFTVRVGAVVGVLQCWGCCYNSR